MLKISLSKKIRNKNFIKSMEVKGHLIWYYFDLFCRLFEFENVPETVNMRFFNEQIFLTGKACFFKNHDAIFGLGYYKSGNMNIYYEDIRGNAFGFNKQFFNTKNYVTGLKDLSEVNNVILYDTSSRYNNYLYLNYLIRKLEKLNVLQDNLIYQSNLPYIITTNQSQTENLKNFLKDLESGGPVIVGYKSLKEFEKIEMLPVTSQINNLQEINNQILNIDNQIRKFLGLYNSENNDKKERLIVDEINANNVTTNLVLQDRLKQREIFCETVNKCFGTNIRVKINKEVIVNASTISGNNVPRMEENK